MIFAALYPRVVLDVPGSTRRGWQARFKRNTLVRSAVASSVVGFGGQADELRIDRLLIALWRAVRRVSDMIPAELRL